MAQDKKTAKALREERADLIKKAQLFADQHEGQDGLLSAEDQGVFNQMIEDANALNDKITYRESKESLDEQVDGLKTKAPKSATFAKPLGGDGGAEMIEIRNGFDSAGKPAYRKIPAGERGSAQYQDIFNRALANRVQPAELAALQSDNAEQAGYLLASEQFSSELLKAVDDECFVRQYANITQVPEADSLGIRRRTAKMDTFNWSSELTVSTADSTLAYGKKVLTPHHCTGAILVSRDLVRRLGGQVESEVRFEMARDSGETMEAAYMTGNGAQQPLGVFTASTDGISTSRDVQTGSTTSITADGLINAKYSLKQQYRRKGGSRAGARWLFHRDARKILAKLKDGNGNYLLNPGRGIVTEEEDMLLDLPVDESEFAPNTFTTGLYVGLLANWNYYRIADAMSVEIQVLMELYAATNQIGYIGRLKTDGLPVLEEAFARLVTN